MIHLILTLLMTCLAMQPLCADSLERLTAALPEIDAPPQGELQWVARSMRLNGLPMTLQVFQSRLDPDALLNHYESWSHRRQGNEVQRSANAPWKLLAIKSPGHYITIRARATVQGSEGTITVSPRLEQSTLMLDTTFPRPASTRIVNLQQYVDPGSQSEHISLVSPRAVMAEALDFEQLLTREGWTILREQRSRERRNGHVLEVQRGAEHALISLQPDQAQPAATSIVIVWRKE